MKKLILSMSILILLNLSIFYVDGSFLHEKSLLVKENVNPEMDIPFLDVEKEIQPADDHLQQASQLQFNPSPIIENNISADLSFSVNQQEEALIVNIDLEKQVLSPDETLNYVIQAMRGFEPAEGEQLVLEIIEGEYWGWYWYWFYDTSDYQYKVIDTEIITIGPNGEYPGHFTSSTSGRYTIVVRSSEGYVQETRSFTIADIGLFWRISREFVIGETHSSVAYILDTTDFSPIDLAEVTLSAITYNYNSQTSKYETQTVVLFTGVSENGIVDINFTPPKSLSSSYNIVANLSATYNGQTVYVSRNIYRGGYYWSWDGYSEHQPYEFIVTTDKPIYLPGETIQSRILVWENNYLKVSKNPAQTSFILKILSPSQHVLVHKELKTNSYGVATYSFSLDSDSELGKYTIVTQKEDVISTIEIRVDKYEKPAFRVDLTLDHEYVSPGKIVSGKIIAEYYFGKPVSNGDVKIQIGDIGTITGQTNMKGLLEFQYRLPGETYFEGKYSIPINVTVIDTVGREVTTSIEVQVTDQIYVWAYVNPWFPKINENITLYFGAYQYSSSGWYWRNWKPLADASAEITIFGILSDGNLIPVDTIYSQTDSNGQGQVQIDLASSVLNYFSRFKGLIEIDAKDGRKDSSSFYFRINRNIVEASFTNNDQGIYQAGDTVELNVNVKNAISGEKIGGNVRIRVFDSDYDLIGHSYKVISVVGSNFDFKLSSLAPNGKYLIYIYLETTFDYEWGTWSYYRYSTTVEFSVGSSYQLTLSTDKEKYSLTDSMTISGQITGQTNAPLMIQFIKKGIIGTEFVEINSKTSFQLQVDDISIFAPQLWIFAFAILDDGTILDTSLSIEIDPSLIVEITSDKSIYEPGEMANIHIRVYDSNNNPISTVMAISFIDSSVFGVQADPENELKHFEQKDYWPSVWTAVSWKNRQRDWWFWWFEDYIVLSGYYGGYPDYIFHEMQSDYNVPNAMEREGADKKTSDDIKEGGQEIRDNLPENAYWSPFVFVEDGELDIDLELPDTIGEWTVRVVATTESGLGVLEKYTFKTFLPFFVEIDKEPFVLQDDIFIIKGVVYNYLGELVNINLEIETANGILVLGNEKQIISLPDGFLGSIGWACLAEDVGYHNITLYANTDLKNNTHFSDALRKPLEIIPNGINDEFKASGFISSDPTFSYSRYSESVKSLEFLELSLGLGSVALNSWERLVGYPYGCIEQTISRLIPNALVLKYLETSGELTNETKEYISDMIISGISRVYSQRHYDGGWGWWSSDSSRIYMTSLVLYGLEIVNNSGFYIEPSVISDAIKLIEQKQNPDGSWTPDSWRGIDKVSFTAFVLRSILAWESFSISSTINDAINYIMTSWNSDIDRSTYLAGLYLNSVPGSGYGYSSFETTLLSYLHNEVKISSKGYYWTYSSSDDRYWWRALGGDVEVTSLALKALVENDPSTSMPIIRGAVQWLLQHQSRYGWGNTADTAAAITTIIALCDSPVSSNEDTEVTVYLNGIEFASYALSAITQPTMYIDLTDFLSIGENIITLTKQGIGNVSYYFSGNQVLRRLPTIDVPAEIEASPGLQIGISVTMIPSSSIIFASQIIITPLPGAITPIINLPQTIDQLTQHTTITFLYDVPSEEGTYAVPGFEISYRLSNEDQTKFSSGNIVRIYGPITLVVSKSISKNFNEMSINDPHFISSPYIKNRLGQSSSSIKVEREYSKLENFKKGDLVFVTLTVTSSKEENFLMLEDFIPVGFELEESTINQQTGSYDRTINGITFFFPELNIGTTEITYGIAAMNVRQSLAIPAKLSSMYDEWVETSSPAILGESRIPIDPATGLILKDLQLPVLEKLSLEEKIVSSDPFLDIEVVATDNWGVAGVRVFIKQKSTWYGFDCYIEGETWTSLATGLREGYSEIFVEIIDYAGNVAISGYTSQYLEFGDLNIPILPIIGLLSIALAVGVISSLYVRKRNI